MILGGEVIPVAKNKNNNAKNNNNKYNAEFAEEVNVANTKMAQNENANK